MNRHNAPRHRRFYVPASLLAASLLLFGGCRSELFDQEYGEELERSEFFADNRMARPLVEGTVPMGHLNEDELMYTGKTAGGDFADEFPMEVTRELIDRGRQRYDIYCSPCHGETGKGDGIIVQRGMKRPPAYHEQRLVEMPAGYFFDVITNGFGMMYSYASRVKPEDRWAIVAYIRALHKMEPPIPTPNTTGDTTAAAAGSAAPEVDTSTDTMATDRLRLQDSNE